MHSMIFLMVVLLYEVLGLPVETEIQILSAVKESPVKNNEPELIELNKITEFDIKKQDYSLSKRSEQTVVSSQISNSNCDTGGSIDGNIVKEFISKKETVNEYEERTDELLNNIDYESIEAIRIKQNRYEVDEFQNEKQFASSFVNNPPNDNSAQNSDSGEIASEDMIVVQNVKESYDTIDHLLYVINPLILDIFWSPSFNSQRKRQRTNVGKIIPYRRSVPDDNFKQLESSVPAFSPQKSATSDLSESIYASIVPKQIGFGPQLMNRYPYPQSIASSDINGAYASASVGSNALFGGGFGGMPVEEPIEEPVEEPIEEPVEEEPIEAPGEEEEPIEEPVEEEEEPIEEPVEGDEAIEAPVEEEEPIEGPVEEEEPVI